MADGQGASSALPIWGIYMKKVFEDSTLPYSQEEKFDIPKDFNPCGSLLLYDNSNDEDSADADESEGESAEEGFDELFQ